MREAEINDGRYRPEQGYNERICEADGCPKIGQVEEMVQVGGEQWYCPEHAREVLAEETVRVIELSRAERDFLLAAIRCYQFTLDPRPEGPQPGRSAFEGIRTNGAQHEGLDVEDANDLAEKLNR